MFNGLFSTILFNLGLVSLNLISKILISIDILFKVCLDTDFAISNFLIFLIKLDLSDIYI